MPRKRKPRKEPKIDRDAAALAVQKELGRPLTWEEYCHVWNAIADEEGTKDHLNAK
ncbi:hypothetical protein [Ruegeria sp. HKCCD4315]|nr:hypothetical protein [Ruegeria sp. HKCCD4315]NOG08379.1 hypothetical protein [Ruegeria sp. HKCCD4315]